MTFDLVLFLIFIVSTLEIFTKFISKLLNKIVEREKESKLYIIFKLIFVILFLGTAIYFLYRGIYLLGIWFGIPMDESLLDILRGLGK
ncbi:hypothetical protein GOQ29_04230 [Clostridium sp. D2Q-14]|uniref:hypothetical protein n=1 Tax=Anaeromonas gelatinilytica TaxID=2683194 RepID=UPI00193BBBF2|nr:hypothetical protein [Anaeromonas gelatinilytica]MBS4534820.1 hypothetical protein [Anaeromonas gelatinilytica]